ncbi:hypothetical protein ABZ572_33390 [Streptomyces sp. NPDC018338]|uniref:hypothetical protein n=1 Tax=Streptomyces sp. NPDC018338 TaxID=3157192 RepID=UPI0033FE68D4
MTAVRERPSALAGTEDFGNARHVVNLLRAAARRKAVRLMDEPAVDDAELTVLRPQDVTEAPL